MFYNGQIKLRLANEVQLRLAMSEGDNLLVHQNRRLLSSNYIVMSLMADCYSQAWTKASHHQLKG
jgi:hypothetical protein